MARMVLPEVGQWYQGSDGAFEVVAQDEDRMTVDVQYFDGTVAELDMETWYNSVSGPIAAPEDWSGPFDDLGRGDLDEAEIAAQPISLQGVIEDFDWYKSVD